MYSGMIIAPLGSCRDLSSLASGYRHTEGKIMSLEVMPPMLAGAFLLLLTAWFWISTQEMRH